MRLFRLIPDEGDALGQGVAGDRYDFSSYSGAYEISVLAKDEAAARLEASRTSDFGGPMWLDSEAVACIEVDMQKASIVTCAVGTG